MGFMSAAERFGSFSLAVYGLALDKDVYAFVVLQWLNEVDVCGDAYRLLLPKSVLEPFELKTKVSESGTELGYGTQWELVL